MQFSFETLVSRFKGNEQFNTTTLLALIVLAAIGMGIMSLASLNDKATKGYLVNKLENQRQELVADGEINDMLILRARSLETIENSSVVQKMVKPVQNEIVYVTPFSAVAKK